MFNVGDHVIYGKSGICEVKEIGPPPMKGMDKKRMYYTLMPVYGSETIFIPVDTKVFMRPAICHDEAVELIKSIPCIRNEMDMNLEVERKQLPAYYKSFFETHECKDLIQLIAMIYFREESGHKVCQTDRNFMKDAEDALYGELSVALGIQKEEVPNYIGGLLQGA